MYIRDRLNRTKLNNNKKIILCNNTSVMIIYIVIFTIYFIITVHILEIYMTKSNCDIICIEIYSMYSSAWSSMLCPSYFVWETVFVEEKK